MSSSVRFRTELAHPDSESYKYQLQKIGEADMKSPHISNLEAANTDAVFKNDPLSNLLEKLVAMQWDITDGLHDGADLPKVLMDHFQVVDTDLTAAIISLKLLIYEREFPLVRWRS